MPLYIRVCDLLNYDMFVMILISFFLNVSTEHKSIYSQFIEYVAVPGLDDTRA